MKRNKNVDILRDAAIMVIIVYHAYVLCGMPWSARTVLHTLINMGGELGVTLFFALSGFGIYMSLDRKYQTSGLPSWFSFMKARCKRIVPQYYFCIFVLLLFPSAHLLSKDGIKHILAYVLFVQNLFVDTHGSINGALWTMATIFQFYMIAIWMYKAVKKSTWLSAVFFVLMTVAGKYLMFVCVIPALGVDVSGYFVYGRQLIAAADNFAFGMIAAKIITSERFVSASKKMMCGIGTGLSILSAVLICVTAYDTSIHGLYGSSIRGYFGHTVLAFLFAVLIVSVSMLPSISGLGAKAVSFIAKYQYGIYLWHMPVIASLYQKSPVFQYLALHNFSVFAIMLIIVIIGIGYMTSKGVDALFAGK